MIYEITAKEMRALSDAIKKWQGILLGKVKDHGVDNCPLCKLHFWNGCKGCIIAIESNGTQCDNTPYRQFSNYIRRGSEVKTKSEERRFALAELTYLIDLKDKCRICQK